MNHFVETCLCWSIINFVDRVVVRFHRFLDQRTNCKIRVCSLGRNGFPCIFRTLLHAGRGIR